MREGVINLESAVNGACRDSTVPADTIESMTGYTIKGKETPNDITRFRGYIRERLMSIVGSYNKWSHSLRRALALGLVGSAFIAIASSYSLKPNINAASDYGPKKDITAASCFLIDPNQKLEYTVEMAQKIYPGQRDDLLVEIKMRNVRYILGEDVDYDIRIAKIKDEKGKPVFGQRWWRRRAKEDRFDPEIDSAYVQKIRRYRYSNENPVFEEDWLIISAIEACIDPDRDSAYILEMLSIPNKLGETLLKGSQIIEAKEKGLAPSELKRILSMPNKRGGKLFEEKDAVYYFLKGGTASFAEAVSSVFENIDIDYNLSGKKILRYHQLGLRPDQIRFKETENPNGVAVYCLKDGGAYYNNWDSIRLVQRFAEYYDGLTLVVENTYEALQALEYVPDQELRIIGGHGDGTYIELGEDDQNDGTGQNKITIDDKGFFQTYGRMLPPAITFLDSCYGGKGGKGGKTLANKAHEESGGIVIAATDSYSGTQMEVCQMYPFDIRIIKDGRDITYRTDGPMTN